MKTLCVGIVAALWTMGFASAFTAEEDHLVQITAQAFQPGRLEIRVGEKVTWKNDDVTDHSVSSPAKPALPEAQAKPLFDSGPMKPGDSFSYTFAKEGTYAYTCTLHKGMTGLVVVNPAK